MTVVVGTAGHIDHGKTRLLHALTGIDADRLPEEQRRGMTIDVGYAHLDLEDGTSIDFVDVPGHDKLVGNMLVGAGEIDAVMLAVAADDGPRAQTHEHLALLDALAIGIGIVVITKVDAVGAERVRAVRDQVETMLAATVLAGSPILAVSSLTGAGVEAVRDAVLVLRDQVRLPDRPATLEIDRVFTAKGRGVVVTGTLRGGPLARGDTLGLIPSDGSRARIREIQVHGSPVERVERGGRTALNLGGVERAALHRGMVLTVDPEVTATDRVLVAFDGVVADRAAGRVHAGQPRSMRSSVVPGGTRSRCPTAVSPGSFASRSRSRCGPATDSCCAAGHRSCRSVGSCLTPCHPAACRVGARRRSVWGR